METPLNLTLFYTAHIRGELYRLPRLYTFLQSLKPEVRQGTLLFDLGDTCADDVWHCGVTEGRSTLMVLDGMGYHAVNVALTPDKREKTEQVVTMGLVDEAHEWAYYIPPVTDERIRAVTVPTDAPAHLQICLTPTASTYLEGNVLYLQDVAQGEIGQVEVDLTDTPILTTHTVHAVPAQTAPNPTIVASVEFVESEARYYDKKQRGDI